MAATGKKPTRLSAALGCSSVYPGAVLVQLKIDLRLLWLGDCFIHSRFYEGVHQGPTDRDSALSKNKWHPGSYEARHDNEIIQ